MIMDLKVSQGILSDLMRYAFQQNSVIQPGSTDGLTGIRAGTRDKGRGGKKK